MIHVRHQFDEELTQLSQDLIRMGAMAERSIDRSMTALSNSDKELSRQVIQDDQGINVLERDIEQRCLHLLLRQQPVASDLRKISTALKMVTDIERIGDHAADIAEINLHLEACSFPEIQELVFSMAAAARSMVRAGIDAYVKEDLDLARHTIEQDDQVDDFFNTIRNALGHRLTRNSHEMDEIMDYLMIVKYLERVGDHAVNICEWVEFYKTGALKQERKA